MRSGGCVNKEPFILEKVKSEVGSLMGTLALTDELNERGMDKLRTLLFEHMPVLLKEHQQLQAISFNVSHEVEYEYAVERRSIMGSNRTFIVDNRWMSLEAGQDYLERLQALNGKLVDYWLVRRRKAGKVERV